jgi:hypothetical protein
MEYGKKRGCEDACPKGCKRSGEGILSDTTEEDFLDWSNKKRGKNPGSEGRYGEEFGVRLMPAE